VAAHHNARLNWNFLMCDYLAWRMAFGITTPSTSTVVQPEYDDMRPPGVTNHLGRMVIRICRFAPMRISTHRCA